MPNNKIINVAVHDLKREGEAFQIVLGNSELSVSAPVQRVVDQLHTLYGRRTSKSHGEFSPDENNYPTQRNLREYVNNLASGFGQFTEALLKTLQVHAKAKGGATGGHVFFAHFSREERHYLLVVIVNDALGAALTNQHDVRDVTHLDVEGFRFAGRINISAWTNSEDRYIGFLKGKGNVAEYFQEFLGCSTPVLEKADTQALVSALRDFTEKQGMDQESRTKFLAKAKDICTIVAAKREELSFEALTNELVPDDPIPLRDYLTDPDRKLNDGFVPNRRILGSLVRFKAKTPLWSVEFDREAINSGDVVYDNENQTITLRNLPGELRDELSVELGDEN